ncbi:MAG: hypothetical protein A2007_03090 [Verrucomicrobia bacterium GWC2_42_7]|nr:MAG: hypothetical protein A2007_03090 [Verrucomicrobia bacterium GWC2_42_7]
MQNYKLKPWLFFVLLSCLVFPIGADPNCNTVKSPAVEVLNCGIGGQNSRDVLNRFADILKARPDLIILMVGTNDCLNSNNSIPLEQYVDNIKKISDLVRARDIKLILLTIPPCYGEYVLARHPAQFFGGQTPETKVKKYNDALKAVALKEKLSLVDIHRLFSAIGNIGIDRESIIRNSANSDAKDGVHPTYDGYRLIAATVHEFLQLQQMNPQKVACVGDSITFGVHVRGEGTSCGQTYPALLSALCNSN